MLRKASRATVLLTALVVVTAGFPPASLAAEPDPIAAPTPAIEPMPVAPPSTVPAPPGAPGLDAVGLDGPVCEHATGRVLVKFRTATKGKARAAYDKVRGRRLHAFKSVPSLELVSTTLSARRAAAVLRDDPMVEYVEPDCTIRLEATPNDPRLSEQWGLVNGGRDGGTPGADIGAAEAWSIRTDASTVTVAVIDTGVDLGHPDLSPNLWVNADEVAGNGIDDDGNGFVDDRQGWDFVNQDARPTDDNSHGTHVAGTIGARGNNGTGVSGVAWRVKLMPLKAFNANGEAQVSAIIGAIDYAMANGARVINASFGSARFQRSQYDAFVGAGAAGIVSAVAAGNGSANADETPHYPGAFRLDTQISIAATTHDDELASFSNFGIHNVHVAAPGRDILSTLPGGGYGLASGTSMATPHVAGVAALLLAAHPSWTPKQVRERILGTTRAVPGLAGKTWTGGVVDAGAALSGVPTVVPPAPRAPTPERLAVELVADPAPAPVAAPAPPAFPDSTEFRDMPVELGAPQVAFDASGTPHVGYVRRFEGVQLASLTGSSWTHRQLTSAYDDYLNMDLAVGPDGIPRAVVQRFWTSLARYTDPGAILAKADAGTPAISRVTASCPDADSCYWDRTPVVAVDRSGAEHVVFSRTAPYDQDMVKAPSGTAPDVPGSGLYHAVRSGTTWKVTRLFEGMTQQPALAVEGDGTTHILTRRRDGSASGLWYVTDDGGSWTRLRLTDYVDDGAGGIAVDGSGGVHVAYARLGLGVWYRHRTPAGAWQPAVRIQDVAAYGADIAVDSAGKVHVAFGLINGWDSPGGVRYATNVTGPWTITQVGGDATAFPSIAVTPGGKVAIAYHEYSKAPMGVAVAIKGPAGFASTLVGTLSYDAGPGNLAHAVDANGSSHVAFGGGWWSAAPGVYYATDASGKWSVQRIAAGWPNKVAIDLDPSGRPHIAFVQLPQDQAADVTQQRVAYATRVAGSWSVRTVTSQPYGDGVAIAVDGQGVPNVVWPNAAGTQLRRARLIGGSWTIDTAYGGPGIWAREPAATIDAAGVLHVAFTAVFGDEAGSRLMYARHSAGAWTTAPVTSGGTYTWHPSIAVSPNSTVWIADWRADEGVWVYSKSGSRAWTQEQLASTPADVMPSIVVDGAGRTRVIYSSSYFYSFSGCSVPMCAGGPGLREAVLSGGTWTTTKLSPYWHDLGPTAAYGADGSVKVVWSRMQIGLRALTLAPGTDRFPPVAAFAGTASPAGPSTLSYSLVFEEPVAGLDASDFAWAGTAVGCRVGAPTGAGMSYTIPVTGCGSGTVALVLKADSVVDDGANFGPARAVTAATMTVDGTRPTVSAPTLVPRTAAILSKTSIPVNVSWTGSDAGSGIADYRLERSTDGGATWTLIASGLTSTSGLSYIPSRGSTRFRVQARDWAGNVSAYAVGTLRSGRLIQQTSPSVRFRGTWTGASSTRFSGGSSRYAKVVGRSATYTFTGRSIALVTSRAPNRGKARIYINGVLQATIDLRRRTDQHRSVAWQRTFGSTVTRTIRIVVLGTMGRPRVDVDAFIVIK